MQRHCTFPLGGKGVFVVGGLVGFEAEKISIFAPLSLKKKRRAWITFVLLKMSSAPEGKELGQFPEAVMADPTVPVNQQFRSVPFGQRKFGDPLFRKLVREFPDIDLFYHFLLPYPAKIGIKF